MSGPISPDQYNRVCLLEAELGELRSVVKVTRSERDGFAKDFERANEDAFAKQQELDETTRQLQAAQEDLSRLAEVREEEFGGIAAVNKELRQLQAHCVKQKRALNRATKQLDAFRNAADKLEASKEEATARMQGQFDDLSRRLEENVYLLGSEKVELMFDLDSAYHTRKEDERQIAEQQERICILTEEKTEAWDLIEVLQDKLNKVLESEVMNPEVDHSLRPELPDLEGTPTHYPSSSRLSSPPPDGSIPLQSPTQIFSSSPPPLETDLPPSSEPKAPMSHADMVDKVHPQLASVKLQWSMAAHSPERQLFDQELFKLLARRKELEEDKVFDHDDGRWAGSESDDLAPKREQIFEQAHTEANGKGARNELPFQRTVACKHLKTDGKGLDAGKRPVGQSITTGEQDFAGLRLPAGKRLPGILASGPEDKDEDMDMSEAPSSSCPVTNKRVLRDMDSEMTDSIYSAESATGSDELVDLAADDGDDADMSDVSYGSRHNSEMFDDEYDPDNQMGMHTSSPAPVKMKETMDAATSDTPEIPLVGASTASPSILTKSFDFNFPAVNPFQQQSIHTGSQTVPTFATMSAAQQTLLTPGFELNFSLPSQAQNSLLPVTAGAQQSFRLGNTSGDPPEDSVPIAAPQPIQPTIFSVAQFADDNNYLVREPDMSTSTGPEEELEPETTAKEFAAEIAAFEEALSGGKTTSVPIDIQPTQEVEFFAGFDLFSEEVPLTFRSATPERSPSPTAENNLFGLLENPPSVLGVLTKSVVQSDASTDTDSMVTAETKPTVEEDNDMFRETILRSPSTPRQNPFVERRVLEVESTTVAIPQPSAVVQVSIGTQTGTSAALSDIHIVLDSAPLVARKASMATQTELESREKMVPFALATIDTVFESVPQAHKQPSMTVIGTQTEKASPSTAKDAAVELALSSQKCWKTTMVQTTDASTITERGDKDKKSCAAHAMAPIVTVGETSSRDLAANTKRTLTIAPVKTPGETRPHDPINTKAKQAAPASLAMTPITPIVDSASVATICTRYGTDKVEFDNSVVNSLSVAPLCTTDMTEPETDRRKDGMKPKEEKLKDDDIQSKAEEENAPVMVVAKTGSMRSWCGDNFKPLWRTLITSVLVGMVLFWAHQVHEVSKLGPRVSQGAYGNLRWLFGVLPIGIRSPTVSAIIAALEEWGGREPDFLY